MVHNASRPIVREAWARAIGRVLIAGGIKREGIARYQIRYAVVILSNGKILVADGGARGSV
jgi:hypothetical protein